MATPRMLATFGLTALAVALVFTGVAVIGDSWWIVPVAIFFHFLGFALVMWIIGRRLSDTGDKPDPVTEARLEEEAVEEDRPVDRDRITPG